MLVVLVSVSCKSNSHSLKTVPAVPKSELLAGLPAPWDKPRERPVGRDNGYLRFRALLNPAVPSLPDGIKSFTIAQKAEMVEKYEPWIEGLEECLTMEYWVAPTPEIGIETRYPELARMKRIQQGIFYAAEVAVASGDTERATHLLLLSDRFGDAQSQAGGTIIHMLVGFAIDAISQRAILEGVAKGGFSETQLMSLLATADRADAATVLVRAAVDEFHGISVVEISRARFPETVKGNLAAGGTNEDLPPNWEQMQQRVFGGHADPFDRAATARIVSEGWQEVFDSLDEQYARWTGQREFLREALKPWTDEDADDLLLRGNLSDKKLSALRTKAASVSNPYGRMLAGMLIDTTDALYGSLFSYKMRGEVLKAVIGIKLFEKRFGILPSTLGDLVAKGVLKSSPIDPFTGGPLGYDAKRRIVWSASRDGKDDGGKGEPFKHEPDFVVPC